MKKTNILEMSAHPVYLDEPVADESELVISQRCKSAEQVPPMTHCCTLPDHKALQKHTKNLQTS
ncbi:MAG: prevent-host-death protein, partial [bacterium]